MNIGKSIEFINMKFLVDDSLGLGFLKMSLVLVYHKNCCLGCTVIGGRFFWGTPYVHAKFCLDPMNWIQVIAKTFILLGPLPLLALPALPLPPVTKQFIELSDGS